MSREAARLLWWGLATKTRKTYSTSVKSYTSYWAIHGYGPPFPATLTSLTEWVASLSGKVQAKTIKAYITGVRSQQVDLGYENLNIFHSPQLERIIAGSRRLHGETNTQERQPLTQDLLLRLLPKLDQSTKEGSSVYASFCLAFGAFLRIGEFTYTWKDRQAEDFGQWFLTRRSVRLHKDHLELTLPASKTDPFRHGITLTVAATDDDACPVRALKHLYQRWPDAPDAPLFEAENGKFSRDMVTDVLRLTLILVGVQGHYSGHSFRRGAATSARKAGLSDEEIQLLGRWKSECYRLYITTHPSRILAASRRHQQFTSS